LLSNLFGFDRGFDTFDARLPFSNTDALPGRLKILTDKLLRLFRKHPYLPAEKLNARALDWLDDRDDDSPFFLWLHYMDVHGPYQPKSGNAYLNKYRSERLWRKAIKRPDEVSERERERLLDTYRDEIEYTDACLGELFDGLRERASFDDTTVAITADHGEQFGEHGRYSHPHQLYDELTHVPLIVRGPKTESGHVSDIVELVDLTATLAERGGASIPNSFAGSPLPEPTDDYGAGVAISEANLVPSYTGSIRTEEWRYVRDEATDSEELYRIDDDPDQQRSRIDEFPDVHRKFATRLDNHLSASHRSAGEGTAVASKDIADEDTEERLKDLGYLE
jgi:arylsulfatase A-like enzyme